MGRVGISKHRRGNSKLLAFNQKPQPKLGQYGQALRRGLRQILQPWVWAGPVKNLIKSLLKHRFYFEFALTLHSMFVYGVDLAYYVYVEHLASALLRPRRGRSGEMADMADLRSAGAAGRATG